MGWVTAWPLTRRPPGERPAQLRAAARPAGIYSRPHTEGHRPAETKINTKVFEARCGDFHRPVIATRPVTTADDTHTRTHTAGGGGAAALPGRPAARRRRRHQTPHLITWNWATTLPLNWITRRNNVPAPWTAATWRRRAAARQSPTARAEAADGTRAEGSAGRAPRRRQHVTHAEWSTCRGVGIALGRWDTSNDRTHAQRSAGRTGHALSSVVAD